MEKIEKRPDLRRRSGLFSIFSTQASHQPALNVVINLEQILLADLLTTWPLSLDKVWRILASTDALAGVRSFETPETSHDAWVMAPIGPLLDRSTFSFTNTPRTSK